MASSYRIKRAILKRLNPQAFEHPLLARLDAHQERIANDPKIQRLRVESEKEVWRELRPFVVILGIMMVLGAGWLLHMFFAWSA